MSAPDASAALFRSRPTRIGGRSVEFVCPAQLGRGPLHGLLAVWSPSPPSRWKRTHLEIYRRARSAFLAEMNRRLGFEPILIDGADLEGVGPVRQAAEVLLAARAAGVAIDRDGIRGDPDLLDAWGPVLRQHAEGIASLLAARPQR